MSAKIKVRMDYLKDAVTLRRLIDAVRLDTVATEEWKTKVIFHLTEAIQLFFERDNATS